MILFFYVRIQLNQLAPRPKFFLEFWSWHITRIQECSNGVNIVGSDGFNPAIFIFGFVVIVEAFFDEKQVTLEIFICEGSRLKHNVKVFSIRIIL